ncbi:5-guanidino-2-oxopentanoate decarboxylase [Kiloniella laminariae]|uniref:5-guanidino-2-oxopentanoate decarboxylase n=1 Tax=Kiloniella laminariae TaxID=454162 RepID=A0ABT4LGK4_9PROT|nr:5-guanidino-2-oxopentanoate decarboxylase [Kiloniella laminariae]MCZ4280237.1 5-guanidino-2-oxopentanoate decarboxylase [Kiloniella laminariae]
MITLGEYLIKLLESYDVERVFGIPGVHTVELYRGLANSRIRHHTPRHEQGAGFMADGYARMSGKPGVCFTITGPGLTNIATAMGQAYADSIPMLVISGVNKLKDLGHGNGNLHELPNQSAFASQVSAFSYTITTPDDLPQVMARAFALFEGARPRPVHIEIPVDLMSASADHLPLPRRQILAERPGPAISGIKQAAELCSKAKAPLLIVGGGVKSNIAVVQELAVALDSPVIMTINARGVLSGNHPLAVPASPSLKAVRELIKTADLVVVLGSEIGPTDFDMYVDGNFSIPGTLVRVDIDPVQLQRNITPDLALIGDAVQASKDILSCFDKGDIAPKDRSGASRAEKACAEARTELSPQMNQQINFLQKITTALPGVVIVGDSTQAVYAGNLYFSPDRSLGWFNSATGFGTLGYALPASIGAKLACPERPVVCLTGDGGLQFTLGELGSAIDANTPIIILVWNNNGYQEIKTYMEDNAIVPEGVELTTPDFPAIARAYGLEAEHLHTAVDLPDRLKSALTSGKPTLIQIEEHLFS